MLMSFNKQKYALKRATFIGVIVLTVGGFSPAAFGGNEGKTGEGLCSVYVGIASKVMRRLQSFSHEEINQIDPRIKVNETLNSVSKLSCKPVYSDELPPNRVAITKIVGTDEHTNTLLLETKLNWRMFQGYSEPAKYGASIHEIAVGMGWENSDEYGVSERVLSAYFTRGGADSSLPVRCLEGRFENNSFHCSHPQALYRDPYRSDSKASWYPVGILRKRYFSSMRKYYPNMEPHWEYVPGNVHPGGVCARMGFAQAANIVELKLSELPIEDSPIDIEYVSLGRSGVVVKKSNASRYNVEGYGQQLLVGISCRWRAACGLRGDLPRITSACFKM
ncbi:MAG: hypothetical protein COT74_07755 [Bdellovibrionales bacterium CG10_big_fil_rev_8_21_14_0_10_45_34]|nr:MAG: hypothetical protein COT74_07755 [Bdellovibrionales bacterium CG10_big_fil_rev_8_21_14_0_10_45_34]